MDERMMSDLTFTLMKTIFLYIAKRLVKSTKTNFDDKLYEAIEKVLNNAPE